MADNPSVDPGTTPSLPVEGDDIGSGVIRQGVVVAWGAKDASGRVTTANPLPISDAGGSLTVDAASLPLPTGAATSALQSAEATLVGAVTESAPVSDTASSGLNGRLQKIAQNITSLISKLPAALGANGGLKIEGVASGTVVPVSDGGGSLTVDGTVGISGTIPVSGTVTANAGTGPFPVSDNAGSLTVDAPVATPVFVRLSDGTSAIATLPVSAASLPLPAGAAADATIGTTNTEIGGLTESAPGTDTASSGLNGRMQRLAQRLTSLIALLPASLGQKTMANGLAVTIASDQSAIPVSGTVTATPTGTQAVSHAVATQADGHSANIGLLADASSANTLTGLLKAIKAAITGTVAVSAASLPLPTGAAADATLTGGTQKSKLVDTGGTNVASVSAGGALKVDGSAVTQPVSGTLALSGTVVTAEARATTGAAPSAFTATSSTQVFASNANRKLFTVFNNSDKDLYLMLASAAASVTSYHVKVPAFGGFFQTSDYSGEIRGIMSGTITTGQVNPGEFT